ncbi:MAG: serine hydrolase [Chloroflexi bacterium]|nr:serine hydrolase [Chloroflexota bacterium]
MLVAVSITLLLAAIAIFLLQLVTYSRVRDQMPAGLTIAGVPVGGLTRGEALQQVAGAYANYVELRYGEKGIVGLDPASVSFRLDTDSMLAVADTYRTESSFWNGFWGNLWNQPGKPAAVPLKAEYSEAQLRAVLAEIASVYNEEPATPSADPGSLGFTRGSPGRVLDVDASTPLVDQALRSPHNRRVALVVSEGQSSRPGFDQLERLIKDVIAGRGFDGLASLYVVDLKTGRELIFNTMNGQALPTDPNVAFASMSIMKIPIMIDTFRYWDIEPYPETTKLLTETIELSGNYTANLLLKDIGNGDVDVGWRTLTDDLRSLGLQSTFMVGYYDDLRDPFPPRTPANSRADINTHPDPYMQTTATEMGSLLVAIYQCSKTGGGMFQAAWPGKVTQAECKTMLDYLTKNHIGVLIEGGVPEGTPVAHKHGWIGDTNGDCGIVFSPNGNDYLLCMYLWHQDYLYWDVSSPLMAEISKAVYNYFNP